METSFDQAVFRKTMGHFPTGVVVVTGLSDEGPTGLTLQSFMSLSLDPALILLSVARTSSSWPQIAAGKHFAVNILAADQEAIGKQFARSGADKFAGVAHHTARTGGSPIIDGAVAWIECEVVDVHDGGDHEIIIGSVLDFDTHPEAAEDPLLFYRSAFQRLESN